jgi:PAS domain S-box-containing protein
MSNEPPSRDSEALRESEARKAAILDAALDCVIIMDHEGLIRHWNSAAERTYWLSPR